MRRIVLITAGLLLAFTVAQAQTECESMLEAANDYYVKGDFSKAAKMYKIIQEECGSNYGGAASKLKDCNRKLKEDADFKKCTTIEACDSYLENYPKGRYVAIVKQKRAGLLNAQAKAEEDAMFENCSTEEDCEEYLETYPEGRYVTEVSAMLERLVAEREEDEAYARCTTESACAEYLEQYPNGRYYSRVIAKKNTLETERLRKEREAAKTAYMKIQKIEFANTDKEGNVLDSYGFTMYSSDIKYLKPRITYDGILDESKYVTLYWKIVNPDGSIETNSNSPSGYTYSNSFWVQPGVGNTYKLTGWGNSNGTCYSAGNHRLELWYEGSRIYQTSFIVKSKENALSRGNWRSALRKCRDYAIWTYDNGSYSGQTYDGNRSGLGMYAWNDGSYYIGRWSSGSRSGMGVYVSSSGHSVSNCPDCSYYVGNWSSSEKSGTGTCYDRFGNLIYYGDFYNNKPSGNYPMTGYDSYKFECIEYSSGAYYVGETYNGKRHGKGVYIWSSGDMWYGEWRDGIRDGYGIYMPYQGSVSTGTWKNDTKQ